MGTIHEHPAGTSGHPAPLAVDTVAPSSAAGDRPAHLPLSAAGDRPAHLPLSAAGDRPAHLPLSAALRAGTREEHRAAESTSFVTDLLEGRLSVAAYADMAAQHYLVYRELERAGEVVATARWAAPIIVPELRRLPALEADLAHLLGPRWHDRLRPTSAVQRYVRRLAQVARTRTGFPAHAYVRYLGDLSGGQVVGRMLARHYAVDARALNFYHFAEVPRLKPVKDRYRAGLDLLPLTGAEQAEVVTEARRAFDLNRALLLELGRRHPSLAGGPVRAGDDAPH